MNARVVPVFLAALVLAGATAPYGSASVSTSAEIANLLPSVADVSVPSVVTPTAGGTTDVPVTVTVGDGNGFQDIVQVRVTVHRPDGTVHVATADAVSNDDGSGTAATFAHSFAMRYYDAAAPSDAGYRVTAVATDAAGATSAPMSATFAYAELVAVQLSETELGFGALSPGERSDAEELGVSNMGNVRIDLQTSGSALADGKGHSIAGDRVRYDLGASDFGTERAITSTPYTNTGFDLDAGASASRTTYWALVAPSGSDQYTPSGSYTGSLTLSAIQG